MRNKGEVQCNKVEMQERLSRRKAKCGREGEKRPKLALGACGTVRIQVAYGKIRSRPGRGGVNAKEKLLR